MNVLKSLTTACLVYSLLAISSVPLAQAQTDSAPAKTYHYQTKQVDENGEKYTSSTFQGEGEDKLNMADYMSMATMMAMGLVASSLVKAQPMTTDVMIAAGSGAAYIGAEVYSFIAYDNIDVDKQIEVKMSESGQVDHEQLQALEKQKQSYLNIEDTANVKAIIQAAATVGFMGAAGVAAYWWYQSDAILTACSNATAACPLSALPINNQIAAIKSTDAALMPSCVQQGKLNTLYTTLQAQATRFEASCVPAGNPAGLLASCAAALSGNMAQLVCASHLKFGYSSNNPSPSRPIDTSGPILRRAVVEAFPENGDKLIQEAHKMIPAYYEPAQSLINFTSKTNLTEMNIGHYVSQYDYRRFLNGETSSSSVDDFLNLSRSFDDTMKSQSSGLSVAAIFSAALDLGVDLLAPKAQAKGASMVGVGAAAAGIIYGLVASEHTVMDKFFATPGHRSLVWGGIAAMATATSILSKQIASQMGENARKIDQLINAMRRLDENGKIDTLGDRTGETKQPITTSIVRPTQDIVVDPTGQNKLPCVGGGKPPCKSISGNLDKTSGFIEIQGNPLGTLSSLTGQVADGIQGQSTLTAGTLDKAQTLANQKEAVSKRNKKLFDELNKLRLKNKLKPIDFDKESQRLANAFRNAARKKMLDDPKGTANLLASLAPSAPLLNVEEELKKEEAAQEGQIDGEITAVAALQGDSKSGDNGFSFDFGDDVGNTVLETPNEQAALPDVIEGETGNDIIDRPNIPIWTIISVRYMKSGFPRLLELKE